MCLEANYLIDSILKVALKNLKKDATINFINEFNITLRMAWEKTNTEEQPPMGQNACFSY